MRQCTNLLIYVARSHLCCVLAPKLLFIYTHPRQRDFSTELQEENTVFTLMTLLISVPTYIFHLSSLCLHFSLTCVSCEAGY